MALLEIKTYPDPILREKSRPIEVVDEKVRQLVADMLETMPAAGGAGLAAVQVGVPIRMFLVDLAPDEEDGEALIFINPRILERSRETLKFTEGCLSLPGIGGEVERPRTITIEAEDLDGQTFRFEQSELMARVCQHEYDHLEGVLFTDHLSPLKRKLLLRKLARR